MGILDQIRNTTVADLDKVTGDFSDLPVDVYRPRVPRDMQRIVEGATDLSDAYAGRPRPKNPGMVRTDGTGTIDSRPFADDPRSDAQRNLMESLLAQLIELDAKIAEQAVIYTNGMTANNRWTRGKDGTISIWIGRMIAKVRELKYVAPPVVTSTVDGFNDVPDGRYAVQDAGEGDWIFVKVSTGREGTAYAGRRFVKIQASDELHAVRNAARRNAILTTIRTMGWQKSTAAYGQHIGACGRCGRTLTDATSRALGIGPDCRSKM